MLLSPNGTVVTWVCALSHSGLLSFDLQPHSYASDRAKIAFVIGLLPGSVREWGTRPDLPITPGLQEEMRKVFDYPVRGRDTTHMLMVIQQGSCNMGEFEVVFRTMAAECG